MTKSAHFDAAGANAFGITAYAPGGIGNLGPGLDVLGCAVTGAGDEVHARWQNEPGVSLEDAGHPDLPDDPGKHSCAIAARAVLARAGIDDRGVRLSVTKGLPLSGGQGGSAASAVAATVAVNALVTESGFDGLDMRSLLSASLEAEMVVSGKHLDNLAPSLMGGVCCVLSVAPPDVSIVPVNVPIWFALAHPQIRIRTTEARAVLPASVTRATLIAQMASVASLVTGLVTGDIALIGRSLVDHYAEPARAGSVPGFADAKRAAIEAGAVGGSLSGSGPTTFALCASEAIANAAAEAMRWTFEAAGVECKARVATIDFLGARWRKD